MAKGGDEECEGTTRADIVGQVCERIARGESVASVFRKPGPGFPSEVTFWRWITDPELEKIYLGATTRRGEKYAEEVVEILDSAGLPLLHPETGQPILHADGTPVMVVDRVAVEFAKARADVRKWVASRLLPKRYGDRTTIAGDADNPLAIDVTDARTTLLRGLAPKPDGPGTG